MFIVLTGDPWNGFTACGPFETDEQAASAGELARCTYADSGSDWWSLRLRKPSPAPQSRSAKQWRTTGEAWVRFSGDIASPWAFTGPFDQDRPGLAHHFLQLQPLDEDELVQEAVA